jgi:hypothetical protein
MKPKYLLIVVSLALGLLLLASVSIFINVSGYFNRVDERVTFSSQSDRYHLSALNKKTLRELLETKNIFDHEVLNTATNDLVAIRRLHFVVSDEHYNVDAYNLNWTYDTQAVTVASGRFRIVEDELYIEVGLPTGNLGFADRNTLFNEVAVRTYFSIVQILNVSPREGETRSDTFSESSADTFLANHISRSKAPFINLIYSPFLLR